MTHVLTFDPAGTARCLYTEAVDLNAIGSLEIRRASNIEFNNQQQVWEVKNSAGKILFSHASRIRCLDWEHQYFNR